MLYYNITFKLYFSLLLFVISTLSWAGESAKPLVITTTKPMAIIAKSALMDNAGVEFILPSGHSPHNAVITVSALKKINSADLVLWIGPDFEVRAAKHMRLLPEEKVLTGMDYIFPESTQGEQSKELNYAKDPHIWLSPSIANRIAGKLQQAFNLPQQPIFTQQHQAKIEELLDGIKAQSFITHHDSVSYFVDAFNLQPPLTIRNKMGERRGIKTQLNLREQARQRNARCVFAEPQQGYKDALRIAQDLQLPIAEFDIQALEQPLSEISYADYMYDIALQLNTCFQKSAS